MCQASATGTKMPSLTRNAGFTTNVVAVEENRRNPPRRTMQNPIQFQAKSAFRSSAAVWRFLPRPSSRRSSARFVPSQTDNPVKWISWTYGYPQIVVRTSVPHQVLSSHWQKATRRLYIVEDPLLSCFSERKYTGRKILTEALES